jgi:uncharacterized protein YkwD
MNLHRPNNALLALATVASCAVMAGPATASTHVVKRASMSLEGATPRHHAKAADDCGDVNARAGQTSERALAASTVCLLNQERTSRGLRALRVNGKLSAAAQDHTDDMVRRHYFDHISKSGSQPSDRIRSKGYLSGARSWMVGENLAWGSGSLSSPAKIVDAWMHSPGHRANILTSRYREIGIGVDSGAPVRVSSPAATYTTTFGQRN